MKVTLKLFATLRKYCKDNEKGVCIIEIEEGATVQHIIDKLSIPPDIPKIILVNGTQKTLSDSVHDEDTVSVFPPIAGG